MSTDVVEAAMSRARRAATQRRWNDAYREYNWAWSTGGRMQTIIELAGLYFSREDYQATIETCKKGLDSLNVYPYDKTVARQLLERAGDAYVAAQNYGAAVLAYNRAVYETTDTDSRKELRDKVHRIKEDLKQNEALGSTPTPSIILPSLPALPSRPANEYVEVDVGPLANLDPKPLSYGPWHQRFDALGRFLLQAVDCIVFFGLGRAYYSRLALYAADDSNIKEWREDQQKEWDRLSTGLALLATMDAAILSTSTISTPLSTALWLGGAALSVCGVFIVQYIPVVAITMSDEEVMRLIDFDGGFLLFLLTVAVTSPNAIACWSSALFITGILDVIVQTYWDMEYHLSREWYQFFAMLPPTIGLLFVLFTLVLGFWISRGIGHPIPKLIHLQQLEKEHRLHEAQQQEKRALIAVKSLKIPNSPRTIHTAQSSDQTRQDRAIRAAVGIALSQHLPSGLSTTAIALLEETFSAVDPTDAALEAAVAILGYGGGDPTLAGVISKATELLEWSLVAARARPAGSNATTMA